MADIIQNKKIQKKIQKLSEKYEKIKHSEKRRHRANLTSAHIKMLQDQIKFAPEKKNFKQNFKFHFTKQKSEYLNYELFVQKAKRENALFKCQQRKAQLIEKNAEQIAYRRAKGKKPSQEIMNRNIKITRLEAKILRYQDDLKRIERGHFPKLNEFQSLGAAFRNIPYKNQKMIFGILFTIPWFVGAMVFFVWPLITTIAYSFFEIKPISGGGLTLTFHGIKNYINAFNNYTVSSTIFVQALFNSTKDLLINLPVILIFSLLIAVILNTKFKGSTLVKAIFFIPVVFNIDIINLTLGREFGSKLQNAGQFFTGLDSFKTFLMSLGVGNSLVGFLISSVDRIFTIINLSGVQILIFLAAIQSIPKNLYEAAKVEGATKYETFWKITFPMVTPIFLTALVYTIVDSFVRSPIMAFINQARADVNYGLGSAVAVVYFLVSILVVGVAFLLMKGIVFYYDEK